MNSRATRAKRCLISCTVLVVFAGCGNTLKPLDSGTARSQEAVDLTLFSLDGLAESISTEACTLSSGVETTCYKIVTSGKPAGATVGPFCPSTIQTTADEAGIWFDGSGEVYDLDGEFVQDLASLYQDDKWQLFDPATGEVNVTRTQQSCEGAARPDVDPQFQNHCVECSLEYVDGGVRTTYLIPTIPSPLDSPAPIGRDDVGVALNGTPLSGPAPVDAILSAYTIAAFDDCGGHINTHQGYHYHAATDCSADAPQEDGHAALIGYAMDGYGIYAMLDANGNETEGLDQCRGDSDEKRGYHYHAASVGENLFIGCYHGDTVARDRPHGPPPGSKPPPPPPSEPAE